MAAKRKYETLELELEELRRQLYEANETIEAIRTGQVDALMVQQGEEHQLYTLKSADLSYRVFIEKMTEGAVTLNKDGLVLYCNSAFADMIGRPLSVISGVNFSSFVAKESKDFYNLLFNTCWDRDCKGEIILLCDTKIPVPVQLSLNAITLEEETSLSIILTDLSTQKAMQKQLEHNNRQLSEANKALETSNHDLQQYASLASHDLQEPLRKILIFSQMLQDNNSGQLSKQSNAHLERIIASASRMKMLIIDMLNYSGLSVLDKSMTKIRLADILKEVLEDLELTIADKNAVIEIGELPELFVNRGQIRQVFQNIVSNALKFAKKDVVPVISIGAKPVNDLAGNKATDGNAPFVAISIKDNGIGFNEKYAANIFNLFERLNSKDNYEGTGIGLAITKKIIEKHQGTIIAKGKENKGSEFIIILPSQQQNNVYEA